MNNKAYILFTRVPVPNKVKTRLQSRLTGEEACQVQLRLLQDSFEKFKVLEDQGIDLFLAYSDEGDPAELLSCLPNVFHPFPQQGKTIGHRMNRAIKEVFSQGYREVILTGSDIPNLSATMIQHAFDQLDEVVLGPSPDGGYYLVGCNQRIDLTQIFEPTMAWGKKEVLHETLKRLEHFNVVLLPMLQDIDHPEDLKNIRPILNRENHHFNFWLIQNQGWLE